MEKQGSNSLARAGRFAWFADLTSWQPGCAPTDFAAGKMQLAQQDHNAEGPGATQRHCGAHTAAHRPMKCADRGRDGWPGGTARHNCWVITRRVFECATL